MSVPKSMQLLYDQIASLVTDFCRQYLSDDYEVLCLRLLEKLCRKRPSPLLSGRVNTWAAGIVYAIASNNYIFDRSQPIHMTADELSAPFGISKSTAANKAAQISRLCGVSRYDVQWLLPELVDSSPQVWYLQVNGIIIDIRCAPVELQVEAYERGFIPYVPAFREAEKMVEAVRTEPAQTAVQEQTVEPAEAQEPKPAEPEDYSDIYRAFGVEPDA